MSMYAMLKVNVRCYFMLPSKLALRTSCDLNYTLFPHKHLMLLGEVSR